MNRKSVAIIFSVLTAFLILLGGELPAFAAQKPDNTEKNKRDRAEQAITADQQGESEADRELARKIRKDITDDDTMSTYAQNAKVITRNGNVRLRGPVRNTEEKNKIAGIAARHAGKGKVTNELEIAPAKDK
jgi:osmotically-inducible protein OsmY